MVGVIGRAREPIAVNALDEASSFLALLLEVHFTPVLVLGVDDMV